MEKQKLAVAMCDFACDPKIRESLDRLGRSDVVILPKACEGLPKNTAGLKGKKIVFAGCPAMDDKGIYRQAAEKLSLEMGDFKVLDVRREIFDLYRDPAAAEENLNRKLDTYLELLADAQPVPENSAAIAPNVLVYGSGYSGLKAALALSPDIDRIDIIDTADDPSLSPGCLNLLISSSDTVESLKNQVAEKEPTAFVGHDEIRYIRSFAGGFSLGEKTYGSLIFAPERAESPPPYRGSLNLSDLYNIVSSGKKVTGTVVFLLDWAMPSEIYRDVLSAALYLKSEQPAEIWILTENVQVASRGQEEMYDMCREAGVVFVKYHKKIEITEDYGDFLIRGKDIASGAPFEISQPTYLVVPGPAVLPDAALDLAQRLGLRILDNTYSQPTSQWRLPNETNRSGVFAAGSARANLDARGVGDDAAATAIAVKNRFTAGSIPVKEHIPVVDSTKCVFCLTCIRVCPFGAMERDMEEKVARVIPAACESCGMCVAECPAEALELRNLENTQLYSGLKTLMEGAHG